MKLAKETKQKIIDILDSKEFMEDLYAGLDPKKREELGQFYTPASICIKMIEKFDCKSFKGQNILDPTVGSGNLLIACLIAGADSDKVFGNEYDEVAVRLCRKRINRACEILGIPAIQYYQIHQGNALQKRCLTDFSDWYCRNYNAEYIDDLNYAQGKDKYGRTIDWNEENKNAKIRADMKKETQGDLFGGF